MKNEIEVYTVPQIAEMLGISTRSVWTLITEGQLPTTRIGKRIVRITSDQLAQYLKDMAS